MQFLLPHALLAIHNHRLSKALHTHTHKKPMKERPWHSIGGKRQSLIRNGVQNKPNEKKRSKSEKKKTLFCGLVYIYIYLAALSRTKYGKPPLIYICRIYQQTHVYSGIQRRLLPGGNIPLDNSTFTSHARTSNCCRCLCSDIYFETRGEHLNSFLFLLISSFSMGRILQAFTIFRMSIIFRVHLIPAR